MKIYIKKLLPTIVKKKYLPYWYLLKQENQIFWGKFKRFFLRPPFPKVDENKKYLHIGCGHINAPQFINIDGFPLPHIHYVRELDDLGVFMDSSIDLIYACHCLEHFSYDRINGVLSEWFRVLKKGGILRISVPDFDLLLNIYYENYKNIDLILPPLLGGGNIKYNVHLSVFNKSSLEKKLINTGFYYVQDWIPGSCELTTFNDWSAREITINGKNYPVSLNIEAIK